MTARWDVIVIGGGHNGLVCGAYLAKAGLKTLVLERRHVIGGAAVSEEIVPGFTFSVFSFIMANLHPKVIRELDLESFGLRTAPAVDLFNPLYENDFLVYSSNVAVTQASFARFSKHDAERYPDFVAHLRDTGRIVRSLLLETPIDPVRADWRSFKKTVGLLWRHRRIGDNFYRMIDLLTQSADDYLSQWFESTVVRGMLSYWASIGNFMGPKTPGSAWAMLYYIMGEHGEEVPRGHVIGGMGTITQAIAKSGARFGMQIKTDSEVAQVVIENGQVRGVVTAAGDRYDSSLVVSNAHCKVLFDRLIDERHLPSGFLKDIRAFRTFSTAWKINIACDSPPRFSSFDSARTGLSYPAFAHIAPDVEYLERAYDDAKGGWYSAKPFVSLAVPTIFDESMAPKGKHVVHLYGGHAPYQLKNGDWNEERNNFARTVLDLLDEFAPGFSSAIIDMQVLAPPDIERILNMPQGHILHGEMSADQMFFQRPVPHYADYRTPIRGLYQCGSSCHPGGGVTGIPGHNAAREMLRDVRRRFGRL